MNNRPLKNDDKKIKRREGFFELMSRLNAQKKNSAEGEETRLEKKDWLALLASAFFTLFLPAVAVLVLLGVLTLALFGYFG